MGFSRARALLVGRLYLRAIARARCKKANSDLGQKHARRVRREDNFFVCGNERSSLWGPCVMHDEKQEEVERKDVLQTFPEASVSSSM